MTIIIIISICILLLIAYVFDITASKTKIPTVILLLTLGYGVKQATLSLQTPLPYLTDLLPLLGTVGLILIVLEGALELKFNKAKLPIVGKIALMSFLPMLLFSMCLALCFQYFGQIAFKLGLTNAIPLAVISSAIAIPSAHNLMSQDKEFITYESSLSDIFGVLFFNFMIANEQINTQSFWLFAVNIIIILAVTFGATTLLARLLGEIKHPVKYVPIILMVVLIYAVAKIYHLPSLIFVLLFGLFLGNLDEIDEFEKLKNNKYIQKLQLEVLNKEVPKFKELTTEIAFLVRSLFFLLFGFLIESSELLNSETAIWAFGICIGIFLIRFLGLKLFKLRTMPAFFIAPRGLITILLFLSIPASQTIPLVNKSLIIQVIVLTALFMMFGLLFNKKIADEPINNHAHT